MTLFVAQGFLSANFGLEVTAAAELSTVKRYLTPLVGSNTATINAIRLMTGFIQKVGL